MSLGNVPKNKRVIIARNKQKPHNYFRASSPQWVEGSDPTGLHSCGNLCSKAGAAITVAALALLELRERWCALSLIRAAMPNLEIIRPREKQEDGMKIKRWSRKYIICMFFSSSWSWTFIDDQKCLWVNSIDISVLKGIRLRVAASSKFWQWRCVISVGGSRVIKFFISNEYRRFKYNG